MSAETVMRVAVVFNDPTDTDYPFYVCAVPIGEPVADAPNAIDLGAFHDREGAVHAAGVFNTNTAFSRLG